jgi:hypothetical protein
MNNHNNNNGASPLLFSNSETSSSSSSGSNNSYDVELGGGMSILGERGNACCANKAEIMMVGNGGSGNAKKKNTTIEINVCFLFCFIPFAWKVLNVF